MMRYGFMLLCTVNVIFAGRYAIVVSDVTNSDPGWHAVVESLTVKHSGYVFTWQDSVAEVKNDLSVYRPDYIAFVARPAVEVNVPFVERIWDITRELDADPYGDAVWGIDRV